LKSFEKSKEKVILEKVVQRIENYYENVRP